MFTPIAFYISGALCFLLWEYEQETGRWGSHLWKSVVWLPVVWYRAGAVLSWHLGNVLIERRLRAEDKAFWLEKDKEEPDTTLQAFFNEHYADDIRASHEARDAMIAEAVDAHFDATNDENSILERPTLDELRIRALGKEEIEDDDGGITFA